MKDGAKIEHMYSRVWYVSPHYTKYANISDGNPVFLSTNIVKEYNCFNCSEDELAEEYALTDGTISIAEAIACAERAMEKYKYIIDENINYKAAPVRVYAKGDGTHGLSIVFGMYYGDIPFLTMPKNYNDTDEIAIRSNLIGDFSELTMVR